MDSAIPHNLRCPRSQGQRKPDGWAPPYPAWASNAPAGAERLAIGYFGVQWRDAALRSAALADWETILAGFALENGPVFFDRASYTDQAGYETRIAIAYWRDERIHAAWSTAPAIAAWWQDPAREVGGYGLFREILSPRIAHFEALFSSPEQIEGAGILLDGRSEDMIEEHAYWGSMRDRIALAQTDPLEPKAGAALGVVRSGNGRTVVTGHDYIALIRSGQDWGHTAGRERDIYLGRVEPVLAAGMNYLSKEGQDIGCYSNRYMRVLDDSDEPTEKSFGMSFWRSLSAMEGWAEHHPTHLAIFNTFLQMGAELDFKLDLVLYHEVCILRPDEQFYEYVNCHSGTGLAASLD